VLTLPQEGIDKFKVKETGEEKGGGMLRKRKNKNIQQQQIN